ncbi:hypothetical protein CE91St51_48680 [[Clostridium] innocuum]|nr:hypothetical protein CE91St51_48680 [[Clostridium] innocuum]
MPTLGINHSAKSVKESIHGFDSLFNPSVLGVGFAITVVKKGRAEIVNDAVITAIFFFDFFHNVKLPPILEGDSLKKVS